MATPPSTSANFNTEANVEHASKADDIRSSLGKSTVSDFGVYRDILEEHHDRRERIIKLSRDINNLSKKMIFALHRAEPKEFHPQFSASSEALAEFKEKHAMILKLFQRAAIDLQGANYHRYQRSISGALQEYIEAMTLHYYLVHGQLMPKDAIEADFVFLTTTEQLSNPDLIINPSQIQLGGGGGGGPRGKFNRDHRKGPPHHKDKKDAPMKPAAAEAAPTAVTPTAATPTAAPDSEKPAQDSTSTPSARPESKVIRHTIEVTNEDYLLGVADLTGELMRLAINALGQSVSVAAQDTSSSGGLRLPTPEERVQHILSFLRNIKSGFDGLSLTRASPIFKKMGAFKQSLNKIEMACYNVKVRGAEYPPEILREMLMSGPDSGAPVGGDDDDDEE